MHALKSSARIIGAEKLGELAEMLEKAGKENNTDLFGSNIDALLNDYRILAEKNKLAYGYPDNLQLAAEVMRDLLHDIEALK